MKKTVIGIALIISALFAGTAVAQTPAQTDIKVKTETCEARNDAGKARDGKKAKRQNPFEGLNLTADQQTRLDALAAERKGAATTARAERAKEREMRRDAGKAKRKEYLAKVKSILTPEQYVQFLEQQAMQKGGRKMATKGGDRHGKKGRYGKQHKGMRPAGTTTQTSAVKG